MVVTLIVKLKEQRPFMFRGQFIWGRKDDIFEVIEEKEMPCVGMMYKIRYRDFPSMVIEGWNRAEDFEVIG